MNEEEFFKKILYEDYLTTDQKVHDSGRPGQDGSHIQTENSSNDLDRLLAEVRLEFNLDMPECPQPDRPVKKQMNTNAKVPEKRTQGKSANGPVNRPANNPVNRPVNRPVSNPVNAPANGTANRPVNRPTNGSSENMLPDRVLSRELMEQMQELSKEVKLLRAQLQSDANNLDVRQTAKPNNGKDRKQSTDMETKEKGRFWWIGEAVFYLLLVGVIVGAFLIKSNSGGRPTLIAGYSGFTVLTSSMEDTIPKGSLVITKSVDPNSLKIGDDITYMSSATSTITHRIVEIREDYMDTDARAFITKGTMNKNQDKNPVAAANVVGKVVFHSKMLGSMATFLSKNWPIVLFIMVVLAGLFYVLKWIFKSEVPANEQAVLSGNKGSKGRGRYSR